ncbi:MAG: ABC transporter permease [Gemmatimonadales bacterium]|nr:ABC transporter permease [Gemmatimonadales bacterium]MBP6570332.1 ABC transporter permease [Gemmatimonadales bacterium]MBP7620914.1 ABC transporter permease [Gemmatimonadales bacterium]
MSAATRSPDRLAWISPAVVVALLGTWEAGVRWGGVSPLLTPAPSTIVRELLALLANGVMITNLGATLLRLTIGLILGAGIGVALGLAMGWWPTLRRAIDPIVAGIHPIPKIALFPILIVLLGIGEESKVAAIAIGAFFPSLINTMAGVQAISPVQLDLARNYGAGTRAMFFRILLPGSLPLVLTGLRISANVAFLSAIGVEMISAHTGLGSLLWLSWQVFRIEQLYATLIVVALVGMALTLAIRTVTHRWAPWLTDSGVGI